MPSTTSSSVSSDLASSTVMTPSLPTFFMASAMNLPISESPFAEIVPTCAISSFDVTAFECFFRSSTMPLTARSTPCLRSIGFMPAATPFVPSLTIAWARIVAVVVPSPACSEVFEATSRTICAPMFSNLFSSSISLATVTPFGDARRAERLIEHDIAAFGAECYAHRVGENVDPVHHFVTSIDRKFHFLGSHVVLLRVRLRCFVARQLDCFSAKPAQRVQCEDEMLRGRRIRRPFSNLQLPPPPPSGRFPS